MRTAGADAAAASAMARVPSSSRMRRCRCSSRTARPSGGSMPRATAVSFVAPKRAISRRPSDAFVPPQIVRQLALRRGDLIEATTGRDQRGRLAVAEVTTVNGGDPTSVLRRPDFSSLIASYPERKLTLETGQSPKISPELTRRAIDLIAPIGYGQRALIVAPARAGKTMLLQAITEGDRDQSSRGDAARAARGRASRRSERDDLVGARRSRRVELRPAGGAPRGCRGHDARARAPARRAGARMW